MGCMVGVKGGGKLAQAFPHVDVFMPPSEPGPLVDFLLARESEQTALAYRHKLQDEELNLVLPLHQQKQSGYGPRARCLRLQPRLYLLHHSLPARAQNAAAPSARLPPKSAAWWPRGCAR